MKRIVALAAAFGLSVYPALAQVGPPIGPGNGNSGGGGGASGVSSISTTCPSASNQTGAVTLSPPAGRTVTGSTDTLVGTDCGSVVEYQNATSTAVTLTAAATLGAKWCANVTVDSGAGTVTVTSGGGNFNTTGNTTLTLAAKAGVSICTNAAATAFLVGAGSGGGGSGNVTGPGTSTNGDCASFNGTAGTTIQDSGVNCAYVAQGYAAATSGNGVWYPLWAGIVVSATGNAQSQNTARCAPFYRALAEHWDSIAINVTTLGTGPLTFAIYADAIDTTTHRHQPQSAISGGTGSWTVTGTGSITASLGVAGTGIAIPQGLNWLCINDATAADAVRVVAIPTNNPFIGYLVGSTSSNGINVTSTGQLGSFTTALTSGTWTSLAGLTLAETTTSLFPNTAAHIVSTP